MRTYTTLGKTSVHGASCTCENASLLRIGIGNVELAALCSATGERSSVVATRLRSRFS